MHPRSFAILCALALALRPAGAAAQSVGLTSFLSGAFTLPASPTPGWASASASFDPGSATLSIALSLSQASATSAWVGTGAAGQSGPQVFALSGSGSFFSGSGTLNAAQLNALVHEGLYLETANSAQPNAGLRGQLRLASEQLGLLASTNVVPPAAPAAPVVAWASLLGPQGSLLLAAHLPGSAATAVHLHRGAAGQNGPILASLAPAGASWLGFSINMLDADLVELARGGLYIDVHTAAQPAGALRDQLRPGALNSESPALSVTNGGKLAFTINAGPTFGGQAYWLLGSTSGTQPGLAVSGLPLLLNPDSYFFATLNSPNVPPLSNSFSFLGATGQGKAFFTLPPGSPSALIGVTGYHALAVVDLFAGPKLVLTSNSVPLTLLP